MLDFLKKLFDTLWRVFGRRGNAEDAWIDNDAALTPREGLIRRITRVLQWGAIINAAVLIVSLVLVGFRVIDVNSLPSLLLGGVEADPGVLVIAGLIGIAANMSLLLLLSAGNAAQEIWTVILMAFVLAGNIIALVWVRFFPALLALIPAIWATVLGFRDPRAYHPNAVMLKELRGRMRGVRSFAIITIFLSLMGSFTVLLYLLQLPRINSQDTIITGELGRLLFIGVVGIELLLIVFIVPALTAGAVTGERERKTFDLLQTTLLSAPSFIVGKMESALGYILILLLSAIPLQSIAFLFGGVSGIEVAIAFILLTVTAFALGALGMFFSALTERTLTATVRVYTVAVVLVFGLPIVSYLLFNGAFGNAISGVAVNADSAIGEATLIYGDMIASSLNPVTSAFYTQQMLIDQQKAALFDVQLASNGQLIPVIAPWIITSVIYIGVTAFLINLAVRQMRRTG
jgi:ABC-2 type transport system permease protein